MINEALYLSTEWFRSAGTDGVAARLAAVPRLPGDAGVNPLVEIHSELDDTPQGKDLALNIIPRPTAGKVLMGITLGRAMFGLDPSMQPPVRDHQVPIACWFMRRIADSVRGTKDLGYAFRAALQSLERFKQNEAIPSRSVNGIQLKNVLQTIPLPTYQKSEDTELLMGFMVLWNTEDITPKG